MAFRTNKMPVLQTKSASGSVATFNTALAMPLASCNIAVNAYQEGSGDPSPSNVRAIHGFSEVNVTANNVVYTIQLGQEVYGAEVDVVNGVAHVTHKIVDLGSLTWVASEGFHYAVINNGIYGTNLKAAKAICDHYKIVRGQDFSTTNNAFCYGLNNRAQLWVNDSNLNSLSASDFKTAISNTFVVYELATPFDIQLTPQQIETLIGNNTIFADTGDIDLTYKDLDIAKRGSFREVFKLP